MRINMSSKAEAKKTGGKKKKKKKKKKLFEFRGNIRSMLKMKLENNKRNFSGENADFLPRKKKKNKKKKISSSLIIPSIASYSCLYHRLTNVALSLIARA